ncbi:hypothetical protein D1007_41244 [Hordeum vulgare]|uniref:Uncharacterized protein n=1 Tax=Hordeum vulgare subsp. vulgare TaxID=112509 RepID=A0A8I6XFR7_HORVV|nr:hypothetical protein D1007_41244 [Hordeum vulgare]
MKMEMEVRVPLSEEEEIRSMVNEGIVDPHLQEFFRTMQSELQAASEFPTLAQLDWLDGLEDAATAFTHEIVEVEEDLRHGAAVFNGRAGEEALVSELLSQAAWCGARRAEAVALVGDARRLRDGYLRKMARTEEEQELIASAAIDFLEFVTREVDGGKVPEADAARAEAIDTAARAGQGVGARFAAMFVGLAERLRGCAEAYTGEVAGGLRRRAAEVEALCADPEVLVARALASGCWRLWRYQNRHASRITSTQSSSSMPATASPTPAPTLPRPL